MMGEREPGADRHLRTDDPMAAKEILFAAEHVHRAALAVRIAAPAAGQLGHHPLGVHAGSQHVTVVAIGGDDRVAFLERRLHTDDDGLLPDIEVTEAADQTHAVHLSGPLFEAPDQQHVAVVTEQLLLGDAEIGEFDRIGFALDCHIASSTPPPEARPREFAGSMVTKSRRCNHGGVR